MDNSNVRSTIHGAVFPNIADARNAVRHVFVRDLTVLCSIGVYAHERTGKQRVRLNLDLAVFEGDVSNIADHIGNVVCYEEIVNAARAVCAKGHINLVETLAEDVAQACLVSPQVRSVRVRVEKLDVFEDAFSVGVEIERLNPEASAETEV